MDNKEIALELTKVAADKILTFKSNSPYEERLVALYKKILRELETNSLEPSESQKQPHKD